MQALPAQMELAEQATRCLPALQILLMGYGEKEVNIPEKVLTELPRDKTMPETDVVTVLLADLRWWGNAIAGNGPMGGYTKAARDAEKHWYEVTLPMLYQLNAVYSYQVPNLTADLGTARKHLTAYLPQDSDTNGGNLSNGNKEKKR